MTRKLLSAFIFLSGLMAMSQTTIKGTIFNEYLEPFPGAIINSSSGSVTSNFDGEFILTVKKLPITITISSIGYSSETLEITDSEKELNIILKEAYALNQVVMSASRTPERVMESPVSIERIGVKDIKNTSSVNFYESLANLKGIDVLSNSFNIKNVVSNRGFANTENTRFVQIVDGTESTLPFINYSLGNSFGLNELDVENVEVLPGAASALYGPNALNGILLMTSKNPFENQGISTYFKTGVTTQEGRSNASFYDVGVRMAYAFTDKFAAKVNLTYNKGEEWHATDYRNTSEQGGEIIDGDRNSDPGYDGLNVYGDEIGVNLIDLAATGEILGLIPAGSASGLVAFLNGSGFGTDINLSRQGYNEVDLIDNETKSLYFDAGLYYRPFGNNELEISFNTKYSLSDNIIHGSNRYVQKDGLTQQHKLELKGKNFFLRGYYTQNDANLVDPRLTAFYLNESFKDQTTYFFDYFVGLQTTGFNFNDSRAIAEAGKAAVGSQEFNNTIQLANSTSVNENGASLKDESGFYHVDGNYNFRDAIEFADLQIGGSFRRFILNSNGQIYTDDDGRITFDEFGAYAQLQKKLLDDRLSVTLTGRFDKSKNFDGNFSPRASVAYAVGEKRDHNFRVSFQTGFRNPTTQDQYASTNLGDRTILGSVEENINRELSTFNSPSGQFTLTGDEIKNNSYTLASVENFRTQTRESIGSEANIPTAIAVNANLLEKAEFEFVKPETVKTIELGYRGATRLADNLFEFDVAGYYNTYENFLTQKTLWTPYYRDGGAVDVTAASAILFSDVRRYIIRTNTDAVVNSYGVTAGFVTKVFSDFNFGVNYAYANFEDDGTDAEFKAAYNTPEHKVKVRFGNDRLFKNFGFNINARWQDEFYYQSVFIDAIVEARTVLDAQINYTIPQMKSTFKLGGTNLGGENYTSVPGTGTVGSQYYLSWTINN